MNGSKEMLEQVQEQLASISIQADNGDIEILDGLTQLEAFRKPLEESLKIIKEYKDSNLTSIETDVMDYKDGYHGFDISVRNGGRMYNYKSVEEWQTYDNAKKECEDRLKQAFISKEKGLLVASEDGEEIELPTVSYRKSSVVIKKK